jgi:hypothetical protein
MRPIWSAIIFTNQTAPSGLATIPTGPALAVGKAYSTISPDRAILPIPLPEFSVNHSEPSDPTVIVVMVALAFAAPDPLTNGENGAGQNRKCTGSSDLRSALLIYFGMRYGQSGLLQARSHDLPEKNPTEVAIADKEEGSEPWIWSFLLYSSSPKRE